MIPDDLFEIIKTQQLAMLALQRQIIALATATKMMDDKDFLTKVQAAINEMEKVKEILTGSNTNG